MNECMLQHEFSNKEKIEFLKGLSSIISKSEGKICGRQECLLTVNFIFLFIWLAITSGRYLLNITYLGVKSNSPCYASDITHKYAPVDEQAF